MIGSRTSRAAVQLKGAARPHLPIHIHTKHCFVCIFAVAELPANASLVERSQNTSMSAAVTSGPDKSTFALPVCLPVCGWRPLLGHSAFYLPSAAPR